MVKGSTRPLAAVGAMTSKVILLCFVAAAAAPMGAVAQPYSGTPVTVPGTIEAERFDNGGEGVGYLDATWGNDGGEFRPYEDVDIRADPRAPGANWIVTNFETYEWMAYTIDVPVAGEYQWGLLASTAYNNSAFHFVVDGQNVTTSIAVPNTGDWNAFEWVQAPNVWLSQGRHVIKIVSDGQYFDLDLIVIFGVPATATAPLQTSGVQFACSFNALPDCGFVEQSKVPGRATLTNISRDGGTALRLHTEPGDTNVVNSGAMERDDVYLAKPGTADAEVYGEGVQQWWAHSILFPDDFTVPTSYQGYVVFDFHNTGDGQSNFYVGFEPWNDPTRPGLLSVFGYGGAYVNGGRFGAVIGDVQKNMWYDFVYFVRWSSGPDGMFDAWVNGKWVLSYQGATLYAGQSVYLKLANYHVPVCEPWPGCPSWQASSVIHDRVVRGTSAQAVSTGPLERYLDLVNGVLTPRW